LRGRAGATVVVANIIVFPCLLAPSLAGWLAGKLAAKSFYSACLHRSHPSPPPSHELLGGYIIAMIQQSVTAFATKTTRKKEQLQQLVPPRKKKTPTKNNNILIPQERVICL
jgi:hypothetical protein